ncbi:Protein kintoun [Oryzias melastigma]|uniref:Protein kintoun n=1 Tax=Oryzias melastigma TaxID=30732 RepID=A0A834F5M6_ORYME|nr:Protein kintoun [Oryzias melastigma]
MFTMEVGQKLVELSITADEVDKLSKAFKNDKFQDMLTNYLQEISNPENVRTYEKEMTLLEQRRGTSIEFVHPIPFRVLETSVDGEQRCFINICACDKAGKPESKTVRTNGQLGQQWSLPHLLQPARPDCEREGKIFTIYDVCFHPETLHRAEKSKRFMGTVMEVAVQGIQKAFNVTLDKGNLRETDIKYKGVPQLCVIRKPIPGYEAKEPPEEQDLSSLMTPLPGNSFELPPKLLQRQPQELTKPHYTVKYRSVVDLQDFRVSRDSVRSPRPTEIVVTIDLPLLTVVNDTVLEVEERRLLLESKNPPYKLELLLSYPVHENKGRAKFNKQTRQLTVTLPVQPAPNPTSDSQKQNQTEDLEEGGRRIKERTEQSQRGNDIDAAQGKGQRTGDSQKQEEEGQKVKDQNKNETPECVVRNKTHNEKLEEKKAKRHKKKKRRSPRVTEEAHYALLPTKEASSDTDEQRTLVFDGDKKEKASCGFKTDIQKAEEKEGRVEVPNSSQESKNITQATMAANVSVPDTERTTAQKMEDAKEQTFQKPEETKAPLPGTLREIDAGGNETILDDRTSAGFVFQNKLVFDLD